MTFPNRVSNMKINDTEITDKQIISVEINPPKEIWERPCEFLGCLLMSNCALTVGPSKNLHYSCIGHVNDVFNQLFVLQSIITMGIVIGIEPCDSCNDSKPLIVKPKDI